MFKFKVFCFLMAGLVGLAPSYAQQLCPDTSTLVEELGIQPGSDGQLTAPAVPIYSQRVWLDHRAFLAAASQRALNVLNITYPGCGIVIEDNGANAGSPDPDQSTFWAITLKTTLTSGCTIPYSLPRTFTYLASWKALPQCPSGFTVSADFKSCIPQGQTLLACPASVRPGTPDPTRNVGECTDSCFKGNPTNVATGNKFQKEADLAALEPDSLEFIRYYNSSPLIVSSTMGPGWRHTFDRQIVVSGNPNTSSTIPVVASVLRPDGRALRFNVSSDGLAAAYPDMTETLVIAGNGNWIFTDENDTTETYPAPTAVGNGQYLSRVTEIKFRSNLLQSLTYDTTGKLVFVSDSFGHALELLYDSSQRLSQVNPVYASGDPEAGNFIAQYTYGSNGMLASVAFPGTDPATGLSPTRHYGYVQISSPTGASHWYLSNIKDEATGLIRSRWAYDSEGRVIKAAKTSGELEVYNFDYSGNSTTVTAPNGAELASESYDFSPIQGVPRLTQYAGKNSLTVARDPLRGHATTRTGSSEEVLEYDSRGRLTRRSEAVNTPRARTTRIDWHPTLRVPTEIRDYADGTGTGTPVRVETFQLDPNNNNGAVTARTETDPASGVSRTWNITRTPYGRPLTVDGPRTDSDIVRFTYYSCTVGYECGRLKTYSNERSKVTTYSNYNVRGLPRTITDPNNVVLQIAYDLQGRVTSRTVSGETTSFSYWPNGLLKRVTLPDGSWTERSYTAAHWLSQITDQDGNKVVYTLDARGNPKQEKYKDAANATWLTQTRTYDGHSRLTGEQSATQPNSWTNYSYGSDGNLGTVTAPLGRGTDYGYDELDRITSLLSPLAASSPTSIQYDLADRVTAVTDPNGHTTQYQYDGFGALTQLSSPDTGLTNYYYAADGRLSSSIDARGVTTAYQSDSMGRPTAQSWAGTGQNVQFFYDEASGLNGVNQLTSTKVNSTADLSFTYDVQGRATARTQQSGALSLSNGYGYSAGKPTSLTTPSGQLVEYLYPTGVARPSGLKINNVLWLSAVQYYAFGPVKGWTWNGGLTELRTRNGDGLPTATGGTAGTGAMLGYDAALRIQSQTVSGTPSASWTYAYDMKDQLTSAVPGAGAALGWTYDLNGNRTSQSGAAPVSYGYMSGTNRLSSLDGISISTDAAGNILNGGAGVTFTYGPRNRMTSSTNAQGTTTYSYNALGERVKKTGPGGTTIFTYDEEGHLIGEYTGTGALIQEIVWFDGLPVASLRPSVSGGGIEIFNISSDHLGTPRVIRRATDGVIVWRWDSDPFGVASPNENPSGAGEFKFNLRFSGQYADAETGLNYNYFRDYNPKTGRYVQSDPIGLEGGTNTYGYVNSDPLNSTDPLGLWRNPLGIYEDALVAAETSGLPGPWNGQQDAYRHCVASCEMTRENTRVVSACYGWANEKRGDWLKSQEQGERAMDDYNNSVGNNLGQTAQSFQVCQTRCMGAIKSGALSIYVPGSTLGYWKYRK